MLTFRRLLITVACGTAPLIVEAQSDWDSATWDQSIWDQTEPAIHTVQITLSSDGVAGGGTLDPIGPQTVIDGGTLRVTATPDEGFKVYSYGGPANELCTVNQISGSLDGPRVYDIVDVVGDCTFNVDFEPLACGDLSESFVVSPQVVGNGSITPSSDQQVGSHCTTSFNLVPEQDFEIASVTGTCGGALSGSTYQTNAIIENCNVIANFSAVSNPTYTVTPSAGSGGSISPSSPQTVYADNVVVFELNPVTGFQIAPVTGTCGGTLDGSTFTTNSITQDCTVVANFTADVPPVSSVSMEGTETGVSLLFGASPFAGSDPVTYSATCDEDGTVVSGWSQKSVVPDTTYLISGQADATISCSVTAQVDSGGQTYVSTSASASAIVGDVVIPTFVVTPSAGAGGSISPSTPQTVEEGETVKFLLGADTNYDIDDVGGSCGGTLTLDSFEQSFTTDPVTSDCSVSATFNLRSGTVPPAAPNLSRVQVDASGATLKITPASAGSDPINGYTTSCEIDGFEVMSLSSGRQASQSGVPIGSFVDDAQQSRSGTVAGRRFAPNPAIFDSKTGDTLIFNSGRSSGDGFIVQRTHMTAVGNRFITSDTPSGDWMRLLVREDGNFFGSLVVGGEGYEARIENNETIFYLSEDGALAENPFLHDVDIDELMQRSDQSEQIDTSALSSTPTVFTVGVQYNNALISAGIDHVGWIDLQMTMANDSYQVSGLDIAFVVVGLREYEAGPSQYIDERRNFITCGATDCAVESGENANVSAWRASIKADFVVQLVLEGGTETSAGVCGIAQLPSTAEVVQTPSRLYHYTHTVSAYRNASQTLCPSIVVAHEIGHNLSLNHNREMFTALGFPWQLVPNLTYYGWGYELLGCYGTVMSYPSCGSAAYIPALSTPYVTWNGYPIGTALDSAEPSFAALTVNVVKGYYEAIFDNASSVLNPPPPILNSYSSTTNSITLSFTPDRGIGLDYPDLYTANCGGYSASGSSSPLTVQGLNAGQTYGCSVTSSNAYGNSIPSNQLNATTESAPVVYQVTTSVSQGGSIAPSGTQQVGAGEIVSFEIEADEDYALQSISGCGGTLSESTYGFTYATAPVTGDCAISVNFQRVRWRMSTVSKNVVFTGLPTNENFNCTATASNLAGTSDPSNTVSFRTQAPSVPSRPVISSADYGDGEIYLVVSSSDGGSIITGYEANCTDGTNTYTGTGTSSPITVSGLTNGVAYTCTVTATNSVGTSSASAATAPIIPEETVNALPIWLLYQATQ